MRSTASELVSFAQFRSGSHPRVQSTSVFDSRHLILDDFSQGGGGDSSKARQVEVEWFYMGKSPPDFQVKCLSWESSRLLLTFLRQEINTWVELEKQIIL